MIKQADTVLLGYPLGYEMSNDVRKADLGYYGARTDHKGPAMTWSMHTIGWLDLGERISLSSLLLDKLITDAILPMTSEQMKKIWLGHISIVHSSIT